MKQLNDIDKIFKDALDGRREAVPPDIWKAVDNSLNRTNEVKLNIKHSRLKGLVKIFVILIFPSVIYLVYLSSVKESAAKERGDAFVPKFHSPVTNQTSPFVLPNEHPFEENKKFSAPDSLFAGTTVKTNRLREQQSFHENLQENKIAGSPGKHQKINYPDTTALSPIGMDTSLQSQLHEKTFDDNARLSKKKQDLPPSKKNTGPDKTGRSNQSIDKQQNRPLSWNYASTPANTPDAKTAKSDEMSTEQLFTPLFPDSIQPVLFNYRLKAIKPSFDHPLHPLSAENSLLKKEPQKIHLSHPVSVTPFGSVNYSFRHLVDEKRLAGRGFDRDDAKRSEQRGSSFSAGILINYGLRKKLFIQSGIVFSSVETAFAERKIYARSDNNGRTRYEFVSASGYSYLEPTAGVSLNPGDSIAANGSSSAINYISLPISINYAWQHGKFILNPGIGLSANFLAYSRSSISIVNSSRRHTETTSIAGLNSVYVDGLFGLGVEYKLTQKLSLEIRPLIRLGLTTINNETPVRTFQNYLNLEAGLKIKL